MDRLEAVDAAIARVLSVVPGLSLVAEAVGADGGVDGVLEFAGARERVALQVKSRANAATAWQLVRNAADRHAGGRWSWLLVHVEGGRPAADYVRPVRLSGKAGVAAQALLLDRGRRWQVQDLAGKAGVSGGLAHRGNGDEVQARDPLEVADVRRPHAPPGGSARAVIADPALLSSIVELLAPDALATNAACAAASASSWIWAHPSNVSARRGGPEVGPNDVSRRLERPTCAYLRSCATQI